MLKKPLKITECPRDAMQGIKTFIPTEKKVNYINSLLKCGFDTIDFGSFVSPKAIPQMQDTKEVLSQLNLSSNSSKLLAIIANERGAEEAASFDEITYLGYPFSISETFQLRNTNTTLEDAWKKVDFIQNLVHTKNKELVVYLSMGFGNPYGDAWNAEIVAHWSERLYNELGIKKLALSDTIGCATPSLVKSLFTSLIPSLPEVDFAAHLHVLKENAPAIIDAAYSAGCVKFDAAIHGLGGCPMAKDDLTGNMPTEALLAYFNAHNIEHGIDADAFQEAMTLATLTFPIH